MVKGLGEGFYIRLGDTRLPYFFFYQDVTVVSDKSASNRGLIVAAKELKAERWNGEGIAYLEYGCGLDFGYGVIRYFGAWQEVGAASGYGVGLSGCDEENNKQKSRVKYTIGRSVFGRHGVLKVRSLDTHGSKPVVQN